MVLSDTTNKQGLIQDIDVWAQTNNSTYPKEDKVRAINAWYRRVNTWIWRVVGDWEYDDSKYTTLPIATCDLVEGQQDYSLPSTAQKILRLECKDNEGNWQQVLPLDESQISDALDEFYETNGFPLYYRISGNSLFLYPAPSSDDVSLSDGLKLYLSRDIDEFGINDDDKEPGFVKDFHRILSMGAALDYCIAKGKSDVVISLERRISVMRKDLENFYATRHRNFKTALYTSIDNSI